MRGQTCIRIGHMSISEKEKQTSSPIQQAEKQTSSPIQQKGGVMPRSVTRCGKPIWETWWGHRVKTQTVSYQLSGPCLVEHRKGSSRCQTRVKARNIWTCRQSQSCPSSCWWHLSCWKGLHFRVQLPFVAEWRRSSGVSVTSLTVSKAHELSSWGKQISQI